MTFLQESLLWGLPAALLPVIIHLLNRLRYRSVPWAATIFLAKATRSSRRRARLRHYLILLSRTLAILFLVLALSRPVSGGWLGRLFEGAPDTILILLDRSASMEAMDPARQLSKREYALDVFARAAERQYAGVRTVLIENVLLTPQETAGASGWKTLSMTAPTDTAADMPAMFRKAADYLADNRAGRTEIWAASDMQRSNWRPESSEWETLAVRLQSSGAPVRVRLLALRREYGRNAAIRVRDAIRIGRGEHSYVSLGLALQQAGGHMDPVPLVTVVDGARSQEEITPAAQEFFFHRKAAPGTGKTTGGWGRLEIPADENPRDNMACFVYGGDQSPRAVVVGDPGDASRRLCAAAAPDSRRLGSRCDRVPPEAVSRLDWRDVALAIWQAGAPTEDMRQGIESFVERGGVLVCFPPEDGAAAAGFGFRWAEAEMTRPDRPFHVGAWEENEGPLARTDNGRSLPLARLALLRRQGVEQNGDGAGGFFAAGAYADGKPFLLRRGHGRGQIWVCTSLPREDWSNLGEGPVLVPMLQRLLHAGAGRLGHAENAACGEWRPDTESDTWAPADSTEPRDIRSRAGVYRSGARLVALNRPAIEDSPERVDDEKAREMLGGISLQIEEDLSGRVSREMDREIWPMLLALALACLIAEACLILGGKIVPRQDGQPAGERTL